MKDKERNPWFSLSIPSSGQRFSSTSQEISALQPGSSILYTLLVYFIQTWQASAVTSQLPSLRWSTRVTPISPETICLLALPLPPPPLCPLPQPSSLCGFIVHIFLKRPFQQYKSRIKCHFSSPHFICRDQLYCISFQGTNNQLNAH